MTVGQVGAVPLPKGRDLRGIVVTTDVHSALEHATLLTAHLHALRSGTVIADCGDFFEGTGYYVLGGGDVETKLLTELYDVVVPGNHGYRHHVDSPVLHAITVCANVTDQRGVPVFAPLAVFEIGGITVALVGVLGVEAFISIPPVERSGHQVVDPVVALHALHHEHGAGVDSWVVLSHAGFAHDLKLAHACPFLDIVFSGHCHSQESGPIAVGGVIVVKGPELARGYAIAKPEGYQWRVASMPFLARDALNSPPDGLRSILDQIAALRGVLDESLGALNDHFVNRTPTRRELLSLLARAAQELTGADGAVFNETCLRETTLGCILHVGELMALEPFGNTLTCVQVANPANLVEHLTAATGPLVCEPQPFFGSPSTAVTTVVTTAYLAATYLNDRYPVTVYPGHSGWSVHLRDVLRDVLLAERT